jgi:hypothetical protein
MQTPPEQRLVVQSALTVHVLDGVHLLGQLPPQSTSVSAPFLMPSLQLAATGVAQTLLPLQKPLMQSVPTIQIFPLAHAKHVPPPQSTSVSGLSIWLLLQVAASVTQSLMLVRPVSELVPELAPQEIRVGELLPLITPPGQ